MDGSEQHVKNVKKKMKCKNCGKQHDGSFGSGCFCSRSCANSRKYSEQTKIKISKSLKGKRYGNAKKERHPIKEIVRICPSCLKKEVLKTTIPSHIPITCSKKCYRKYLSIRLKEVGAGGYREGSGYGKSGHYKGIYCASTYELIFLAYHLEKKNNIKRSKKKRGHK